MVQLTASRDGFVSPCNSTLAGQRPTHGDAICKHPETHPNAFFINTRQGHDDIQLTSLSHLCGWVGYHSFAMLAARDQENLVHSHQVTASAKPLNQGAFKAVPKTPGAKPFKTPFKVPLNDENGPAVPGGGKSKLVIEARQDGPAVKQGRLDKSAFITPFGSFTYLSIATVWTPGLTGCMTGPRNRAPLGMKTTNAKTRAFQTPTLPAPTGRKGKGNDNLQGEGDTLRRIKPIVDDADTATVKLGEDQHDLEEREIEYMPPKAKGGFNRQSRP